MIRRILPTIVSRRCGFERMAVLDSPDAAVARSDVEHAPFGVAGPGGRVEHQIADRVDARVELHAHDLARRALERRVRRVRVGPLDHHAFAQRRAGRLDRRAGFVSSRDEAGQMRVVGKQRTRKLGVLDVHGIEPAVAPVVRVELQADQAVGPAGLVGELVKQTGVALAPVEVEIGRELSRRLVDDVHRAVDVVDEQPVRAARFLAQRVHARQHAVALTGAIELAGDRQLDVVLDLERERRFRARDAERRQASGQTNRREQETSHQVIIRAP